MNELNALAALASHHERWTRMDDRTPRRDRLRAVARRRAERRRRR